MIRWLVALVIVVGLQFVPGAGVRDASAAVVYPGGPDSPCYVASYNNYPASCTRQLAYEACMAHNNYWKTHGSPNASGCVVTATVSGGLKGSYGSRLSSTNRVDYFNWGVSCDGSKQWDDASKTCKSPFDGSKCLAENPKLGADAGKPRPSLTQERCVAVPDAGGLCSFKMDTSGPDYSETTLPGGGILYRGVMEYTGLECGITPAPTNPDATESVKAIKPQECVPVAGQTVCKKADGKFCATALAGRQLCWRPGETGEKTDGPIMQVRRPGTTAPEPSTPPPPGTEWEPSGSSVTTTETTITTTITTTIANYITSTRTEAGAANQGESASGTDNTAADGVENSTSGDGSCTSGWSPSGDPLLSAIVTETHKSRCGDEKLQQDLRADGDTLGAEADALEATEAESLFIEPAPGGVADGGFVSLGTGQCPTLPPLPIAGDVVLTTPSQFCDAITLLRWLFVSIGYLWAIRVVLE